MDIRVSSLKEKARVRPLLLKVVYFSTREENRSFPCECDNSASRRKSPENVMTLQPHGFYSFFKTGY